MLTFLLGILVFWIAVVTDIVWARYTQYVADGHRLKAAAFAAVCMAVGGFSWFAYHTTLWYVLPSIAGAALGTYIGTRQRQDPGSETPGDSPVEGPERLVG